MSSKYGQATHVLAAENAICAHLVFILSDIAFGDGGLVVSFVCWLLVLLCFGVGVILLECFNVDWIEMNCD